MLFKAALIIIVSTACFASGIIAPILPALKGQFSLFNNEIQLSVSLFLLGYLIGQIFYAVLAERKGYKYTLLLGGALFIISCIVQLIALYAKAFPLFLFGRFLCSFGASSGLICSFAIINSHEMLKVKAKKLISAAFISLTLSAYFSISLGGVLEKYLQLSAIFYALFILSIFVFLLILFFIPKTNTQSVTKVEFKEIFMLYVNELSNRRIILYSFAVAMTTTSTYLYNAFGVFITQKYFHLSSYSFGYYSLINLAGLIFGSIISGKSKNNLDKLLGLSVFCTMLVILFLVVLTQPFYTNFINVGHFYLLLFILNILMGIIYTTATIKVFQYSLNNSVTSSILNFIKISCPALIISLLSLLKIEVMNCYKYTLFLFCAMLLLFLFFDLQPFKKQMFKKGLIN